MSKDTIFSLVHADNIPIFTVYATYNDLSKEDKEKVIIKINNWLQSQMHKLDIVSMYGDNVNSTYNQLEIKFE